MQRTRVNVSLVNDGQTVNLQAGPYGVEIEAGWFFDRSSIDDLAIRNNIRLAYQIGGYGHPAAKEFLDAVNGTGTGRPGMQLADRNYFIKRVTEDSPGQYVIGFGPRDGEETYSISMSVSELTESVDQLDCIARNIRAFLRIGKFTSWTPAALNAVNAAEFWG